MRAGAQVIVFVLQLFIVMPIWFYLLYQILVRVNATDLMFFLFWAYVPALFLAAAIQRTLEGAE